MQNQLHEEQRNAQSMIDDLQTKTKTFYEITLPSGKLDKFKPAKDDEFKEFGIHLVLSGKS